MSKDLSKSKFFASARLFPVSDKQKKEDWSHYKTQIEIRKHKFRGRKNIKGYEWKRIYKKY